MATRLLWLAVALLISACSQDRLLTKRDYQESQRYFTQGDAEQALQEFPRRAERGDFITTMERGYLNLIQSQPQIVALQRQASVLENRVRYHVSREAKTFFYLQTPEDYYASEHEVIWLHFLLSWGYALQGKYTDACVEARVAGSLLSLPWSPAGHFDDPAMRLFLAGLWAMCGEWHEAQVDLRAAWFMDNRLSWAKELAERDQPPAHLFVVLGGPGPEPVWNPELGANPLRSERRVGFRLRGIRSPLSITDRNGVSVEAHLSPDAGKWYERHLARESELHELILDSTYGGKAAVSSTIAGGKIAATTGMGLAIGLGGTALGAAIINYVNSSNALELGLVVAGASIRKGMQVSEEGYRDSTEVLRQDLDPSITYRFVRYLPEYLWMGWSDQPIVYPVELRTPTARVSIARPIVAGRAAVSVAHVPDAAVMRRYW
ncbi:MAG: hypothetical protein HY016_09530 [Nitrosomonadales bacterium]|nr:hypothetical protein [Nitrosomonadales bacterium]